MKYKTRDGDIKREERLHCTDSPIDVSSFGGPEGSQECFELQPRCAYRWLPVRGVV